MDAKTTTKLLTKIGFLFLERMGCFNVSTEVNIPPYARITKRLASKTDNHHFIDIFGVQWEYLPPSKSFKGVNKRLILRGIEIKVSKSDFNNGFIQSGCHFHYLMIPKDLISKSEIPTISGVGVIEIDLDKFHIIKRKIINDYEIHGIKITHNPIRKVTDELTINNCLSQIGETLTNQTKRWLVEEFTKNK